MTKEEDLLFCQIAIQTGMVNQDDAKKCLSLAQKLEKEGKRRPSIGAIFVKTNLISQPNVQKLQQAVRKRQQASGATAAGGAGRRGGVRGGRRTRRARGAEPEARRRAMPKRGGGGRRRVSQGTAWLYVGSGVVFLVLIISMVYMLFRAGQEGAETGGAALTVTDPGDARTSVPPPTVKPVEKPTTPPPMDRESQAFKEFANDHRFAVTDSKQFMGDGMYGQALSLLRRVLSAKEPYYRREPELRQKIEEEIEKVEKKIVKIVAAAIAEAQGLAKDGNKSEGESILSDLKEKLAGEEKYVSKIDSAIMEL